MSQHPAISPGRNAVVTGAASGIGLAAAPPAVGASGGTAGIAAEIAAEDGGGAAAPVRGAGATRWADPELGPGYTERMLSPWG